jgi:hypothetical protein
MRKMMMAALFSVVSLSACAVQDPGDADQDETTKEPAVRSPHMRPDGTFEEIAPAAPISKDIKEAAAQLSAEELSVTKARDRVRDASEQVGANELSTTPPRDRLNEAVEQVGANELSATQPRDRMDEAVTQVGDNELAPAQP